MATAPGVQLTVPARAPAAGPIPIGVRMTADMAAYYANHGILDEALEVILVRRDAPGVSFLAKIDPHAVMLPTSPLPVPTESGAMQGSVAEERTLDVVGFGAAHPGAANYHVVAGFSRWVSEIRPLAIDAPRPLPAARALAATAPADLSPAPPGVPGMEVRAVQRGSETWICGGARWSMVLDDGSLPASHVTLVAIHLGPHGGASAACFDVPARGDAGGAVATFAIALSRLTPPVPPGPARILVFCGADRTARLDAVLPPRA